MTDELKKALEEMAERAGLAIDYVPYPNYNGRKLQYADLYKQGAEWMHDFLREELDVAINYKNQERQFEIDAAEKRGRAEAFREVVPICRNLYSKGLMSGFASAMEEMAKAEEGEK